MVTEAQAAAKPAKAKAAPAKPKAAKPAAAKPATASPAPVAGGQPTTVETVASGTPHSPVSEGATSRAGEQGAERVADAAAAAAGAGDAGESSASSPAGAGTMLELAEKGALVVVGPREGRRRAGRSFGREPTYIARDEIDEAGVLAITSDPFLQCSVVLPEQARK